jgi:hypothetical protein
MCKYLRIQRTGLIQVAAFSVKIATVKFRKLELMERKAIQ